MSSPATLLVWEHKAGLNNGLNGRSWGIEWSGSEGTIILNDEGWEIRPEQKRPTSITKKARQPRPAPGACPQFPGLREVAPAAGAQPRTGPPRLHRRPPRQPGLSHRAKAAWDAAQERIVNDPEADKLVGVRYREPWVLPYARRA